MHFVSSKLSSGIFPSTVESSNSFLTDSPLEFDFLDSRRSGVVIHITSHSFDEVNVSGILKISLYLPNHPSSDACRTDAENLYLSSTSAGFVIVKFGTYIGHSHSILSSAIRDFLLPVLINLKSYGNVPANIMDIGRRSLIFSQSQFNVLALSGESLQSEISRVDIVNATPHDTVVAMKFSALLVKNLVSMACESGQVDALSSALNHAAEEAIKFFLEEESRGSIRISSVAPYAMDDEVIFGNDVSRQVFITGQVLNYVQIFLCLY